MAVLSSDRISFSKDSAIRREALRLAEAIVGAGGAAMLDAAPDMLAVLLRGQSLSMLLQVATAALHVLPPQPAVHTCAEGWPPFSELGAHL